MGKRLSLLLVFVFLWQVGTAFFTPRQAFAAYDEGTSLEFFNQFSIPMNNGVPGGWISIEVIDRNTLRLRVDAIQIASDDAGNVYNLATYLDGAILKRDANSGKYVDTDRGISGWEARTTIDQIVADAGTFAELINSQGGEGPELTISLDEDMFAEHDCADDGDEGFAFGSDSDNRTSYKWRCKKEEANDLKGLYVKTRFDSASFGNFAVEYTYEALSEESGIVHYSAKNSVEAGSTNLNALDRTSLRWCPASTQFRTSCSEEAYYALPTSVTPQVLAGLGSRTQSYSLINSDGATVRSVTIAGPEHVSAETVIDPSIEPGSIAGAEPSCSSSIDGIGWIVCPIAEFMLDTLEATFRDGIVRSILNFDAVDEGSNSKAALESIWNGFRIVANVGFVIAFFAVIYSAASGGFISAYDVKKMLPKLLIGAVLVQLSFFICVTLVQVFNAFGESVVDLMLQPLGAANNNFYTGEQFGTLFDPSLLDNSISIFRTAIEGVVSALIVIMLIIGTIFAFTGVFIMVLVFMVRNMALIVLITISPLAMVAWILPNTENLFRRWWQAMIQLLAMFPIAMAFLASGRLVSYVWSQGSDSWGSQWLALIALFLPYIIAPRMFSFAGQAIGGIVRGVENAKDGVNRTRGKIGDSRWGKQAAAGELVPEKRRWSNGLNAATRLALNPRGTRLNPLSGDRERAQARARARSEQTYNEDFDAARTNQRTGRADARLPGSEHYDQAREAWIYNHMVEETRSQGRTVSRQEAESALQQKINAGDDPLRDGAEIMYLMNQLNSPRTSDEAKRAAAKTLLEVHSNDEHAMRSVMEKVESLKSSTGPSRASDARLADRIIDDNTSQFGKTPQLIKPNSESTTSAMDIHGLNGIGAGSLKLFLTDDGARADIATTTLAALKNGSTKGEVKTKYMETVVKAIQNAQAAGATVTGEQQELIDSWNNGTWRDLDVPPPQPQGQPQSSLAPPPPPPPPPAPNQGSNLPPPPPRPTQQSPQPTQPQQPQAPPVNVAPGQPTPNPNNVSPGGIILPNPNDPGASFDSGDLHGPGDQDRR